MGTESVVIGFVALSRCPLGLLSMWGKILGDGDIFSCSMASGHWGQIGGNAERSHCIQFYDALAAAPLSLPAQHEVRPLHPEIQVR